MSFPKRVTNTTPTASVENSPASTQWVPPTPNAGVNASPALSATNVSIDAVDDVGMPGLEPGSPMSPVFEVPQGRYPVSPIRLTDRFREPMSPLRLEPSALSRLSAPAIPSLMLDQPVAGVSSSSSSSSNAAVIPKDADSDAKTQPYESVVEVPPARTKTTPLRPEGSAKKPATKLIVISSDSEDEPAPKAKSTGRWIRKSVTKRGRSPTPPRSNESSGEKATKRRQLAPPQRARMHSWADNVKRIFCDNRDKPAEDREIAVRQYLNARQAESQKEIANLRQKLEAAEKEVAGLTREVDRHGDEIAELNNSLEMANEETEDRQHDNEALQEKIDALELEVEDLNGQLDTIVDSTARELSNATADNVALRLANEALGAALNSAGNALTAARAKIDALDEALEIKDAHLQEAIKEFKTLGNKMAEVFGEAGQAFIDAKRGFAWAEREDPVLREWAERQAARRQAKEPNGSKKPKSDDREGDE